MKCGLILSMNILDLIKKKMVHPDIGEQRLKGSMAGKDGPWYIECTKKSLLWEGLGRTSILPKRAISLFVFKGYKSQFPLKQRSVHAAST
ncbi:hypothetical protein CA600_03055 [Paenibacillus sp. VTT E-133280]|nr:hypothetical protein CA600_03055 [Paenibacillus sp. VTT E-133280]